MGQSKGINSVDYRPTRPFRIATASEDNTVAFFVGPPFKFQSTSNVINTFLQLFCALKNSFALQVFSISH